MDLSGSCWKDGKEVGGYENRREDQVTPSAVMELLDLFESIPGNRWIR